MRVNKRTAMHNIFDSAFLKGYFFPFRIRSVHRSKRRQWEAAGLDVLRRVSATLTFAFLSVTVSRDVCKARRCGMQSSKLIEGSSEVIRAHACACASPACESVACSRVNKSQRAELHLLANPLLQQHVCLPPCATGVGKYGPGVVCGPVKLLNPVR